MGNQSVAYHHPYEGGRNMHMDSEAQIGGARVLAEDQRGEFGVGSVARVPKWTGL